MRLEDIVDKLNIKELIAITAGMVGARMGDQLFAGIDPKYRDLAKVGVGLGATYVLNEMSERNPEYGELLALVGLATTTFAATPIANRITIEVSKAVGTPVVVKAPAEVEIPEEVEIEEKKPEELAIEL